MFADENVPTYDFLIENGVEFIEKPIRSPDASTVDRIFVTKEWHIPSQVYAPRRNRNGSGLVRRLEESARKKGVQIFLKHKMTSIVREKHNAGRVLGITTIAGSNAVNIQARKGVIIATGGHTGNVNFRRIFDPRLTEEYQQACEPYVHQGADGELAAMDIGASLWSTANQTVDGAAQITKTRHIGCRWGYSSLVYEPDSPMFQQARATGLTVRDWQNMIFVNQNGKRFWNEVDGSHEFFAAAMAYNGDKTKLNGGGPIWAIFDADAVAREKWKPEPPHVDRDGYFFSADTIPELAARIKNPYQKAAISGATLQETVNRYNGFVAAGADADFKKPTPLYKIEKPPFYAAWTTPILHDTLTGLRTNTDSQVIDIRGEIIPGLYCAGEYAGRLRPARADALHRVRPPCRPARGAPSGRRDVGLALMTMAQGGALVHLTVGEPLPLEVPAGDSVAVTARASCPDGRDRTGMAIAVTAPDGQAAAHAFAVHADGASETAVIPLAAPPRVGVHVFRFTLPPHEIAGTHYAEAVLDVPVRVTPQATSLAVWDVPSPAVVGTSFVIKAGAKSAADAPLAGCAIEVCDDAGEVAGRGVLSDAPLPGTGALYWTDVQLQAPRNEGVATWSVRFDASELDLPHDGANDLVQRRRRAPARACAQREGDRAGDRGADSGRGAAARRLSRHHRRVGARGNRAAEGPLRAARLEGRL